jgi:hypothetical protein
LTVHTAPPKAQVAFRIGVVGHRPNRLPEDTARLGLLRTTLKQILDHAKGTVASTANMPESALYSSLPIILRAISPLAEGSDRIFAEEALALGYELCSPLPFLQKEFEKDFTPPAALETDSLSHFRELLAEARDSGRLTLFQLEGSREHLADSYAAAGRVVLNQSDLLVTVWDGGEPAGAGGTVHTLYDALHYHVPVIWIDALEPQNWQMVSTPAEITKGADGRFRPVPHQKSLKEVVTNIVQAELRLPAKEKSASLDYFTRHKPLVNLAFAWRLFRDLLGAGKLSRPTLVVEDFENRNDDSWSGAAPSQASSVSKWVHESLWPHYAWADGLADLYADANRSSFLLSYLLSAAAVFAALLSIAMDRADLESACALLELAILVGILVLLGLARQLRWHERWMECRLLAELIRQLRILIPLGGARPLPRMPAHLAVYGDPSQTWMYWHMRAVARACGIPGAEITPAYVRDYLNYLTQIVGDPKNGQWGFHVQSARRAQLIFSRLRTMTVWLFSLTVLDVGVRLLRHVIPAGAEVIPSSWDHWLLFASAALPALGAALEGINNQGEFTRTAHRSKAMAGAFEAYAAQIKNLREGQDGGLTTATALSSKIAQTMVDEVTDWRAVFSDRAQ